MHYGRIPLVLALGIISALGPAYAELISYEAFDYADIGQDIHGKDGGIGFENGWRGATHFDVADGSLSFLGLETEGNRAIMAEPIMSNGWTELVRRLDVEGSDADVETKYLSFLLRPEGNVSGDALGGFFGVDLYASSTRVAFGRDKATSTFGMGSWGTRSLNHYSSLTAVSGQTALFVVKAEITSERDILTLYVNPIPGQPEPVSGRSNDLDLGTLRSIGVTADGAFSVDEIRLGDTFDDVTPAAPTSLVELIGGGQPWKMFRGTTEPSPFPKLAWVAPDFDDTTWGTGHGGFGYGRSARSRNVTTVLDEMEGNFNTLYLRHPFHVENPADVSDLVLQINWDDAFVAYLNGVEVTRSNVGTSGTPEPFDAGTRDVRTGAGPANFMIDLSSHRGLLHAGDENILAIQGINSRSADPDFLLSQVSLLGLVPDLTTLSMLQAGDADHDMDFDQLDLVKVQVAAKYVTGQPATWGEGDWNGAPGGAADNPPVGDGLFDQLDIIAALGRGLYLSGPYAAVSSGGRGSDGRTSITYDAGTGEVAVNAPSDTQLTSINIGSAAGIFTASAPENLGGSFDTDADNNIFKAAFGGSFGSLSLGNVAQAGLSEDFVLGDLSILGSLAGGGDLGIVDLVYVPEPASTLLLAIGSLIGLTRIRRGKHQGSSRPSPIGRVHRSTNLNVRLPDLA